MNTKSVLTLNPNCMSRLFSALLIELSLLVGFAVAFTKEFILHLKNTVVHKTYSRAVVSEVRSKASEAKAWMLSVLSRLSHSPTFC
jgi:hypothetical protein